MNNDEDKKLIKDSKIDNRKVQSFEYEKTAISDGNIIGTCELGTATIQLLNKDNEYSEIKGSWINTIHGSFYVTKVEPVQEKVNIKLECYDIKYKLDTLFDKKLYENTFPCTLKEFRNEIFENCGVSYDDTSFPNSDMLLKELPYFDEGVTNRQVISTIAQAGGCWVDTDEQDKFYFNYFTDKVYEVNDYQELTTEKTLTKPVNTVVLGRGDTEDNVYYPTELIGERVSFRIDNNYILDPQSVLDKDDTRYTNIIPLYNHLLGTQYLVFSMKTNTMLNKLKIKLGDKVQYKDIYGNILTTPIMRKKITFLGGDASKDSNYSLEISSEEIKETSTDYSKASSVANRLKRTEILVDKQNQVIKSVISKTEIESYVELLKVDLDINNITIQVDGGNKPYETSNYDVNYKVYYLNQEIEVIPTTESENTGITVTPTSDYIRFSVDKDTVIPNIQNKFTFKFNYTIDDKTYELSKTIMVLIVTTKTGTIYSETEPKDKTGMWYDTTNKQLKRYDGKEWDVINDYSEEIDGIKKLYSDLDSKIKSDVSELGVKISEVQTTIDNTLSQTLQGWRMDFSDYQKIVDKNNETDEKFKEIDKYIRFEDGKIILGDTDNQYELKIENDRISIYYNKKPIASWVKSTLDAKEIYIGNFGFVPRNDGLSIRRVRVNDGKSNG